MRKQSKKRNYPTYSGDIYSTTHYDEENSPQHKQNCERHWVLCVLTNARLMIVLASVVVSSIWFSSFTNNGPKPENYKVGVIITPPDILNLKPLQLPSIGSVVSKRAIFEDFIKNVKSEKIAKRFSVDDQYHKKIKIINFGKTVDSVQLSMEAEKPEIAKQWLDGFLSFAQSQTVELFVKNAMQKIDNKKDEIMVRIDAIYADVKNEDKVLEEKINKYKKASKFAKNKGIATSVEVSSLPQEKRFVDLLYLQGYWKLDAEINRLKLFFDKKVVDIDSEKQELTHLEDLVPNADKIKAFSLEHTLEPKSLNLRNNKQSAWSFVGGLVGLLLGLVISYPFRRKNPSAMT